MTLRTEIENKKDFRVVSLSVWQKLKTAFGGAPEIPLF
jgi:hypothetical protein